MKYLLSLPILLLAVTCNAVVSIESSIRACDNSSAVTSTSSPVNVGSANDLLLVFVGAFDTTYANTVVNTVTYNAVGLTRLQNEDDSTSTRRLSIWYMINPPTGSNTLAVTWAGAALGGHVHAVVLTGQPTTNPIDASTGTISASVASFTASTATVNPGAMTISFCSSNISALTAQGSGQTTIKRSSNNFWWTSFSQPGPSGTVTHVYSNGTTDTGVIALVSVDSISSPSFIKNKRMHMERYE